MFKDINDSWKRFIIHEVDKAELVKILKEIRLNKDIFHFAKHTPLDIKVVILSDKQNGKLALSSLNEQRNFFKVLYKYKLVKDIPKGIINIEYLMRQGVLLLNVPLTKENVWDKYLTKFITLLKNNPLIIACGNTTHNIVKNIKNTINCPSLRSDKFLTIDNIFPDNIHWDFVNNKYNWYTDGACTNNQSKFKAKAGWGFCSLMLNIHNYGKVEHAKIKKNGKMVDKRPTNNRAELLALINCMKCIFSSGRNGAHIIYSDSEYSIKLVLEWIPNKWIPRNISWDSKDNSDLTYEIYTLFTKINNLEDTSLNLIHCNAFHDYDDDGSHQWIGNKTAELNAQKGL